MIDRNNIGRGAVPDKRLSKQPKLLEIIADSLSDDDSQFEPKANLKPSGTMGSMLSPELASQQLQALQDSGYRIKFNLTIEPPPESEKGKSSLSPELKSALGSLQGLKFDVKLDPLNPSKPDIPDLRPTLDQSRRKDDNVTRVDAKGEEDLLQIWQQNYRIQLKPVQPLESSSTPSDRKWVPIEEAAARLGVTDRTVRRIVADEHVETKREKFTVSVFREMEKVLVPLDKLSHIRENRNLGGRPKKDEKPSRLQDYALRLAKSD